jgi:PAS domain S-box-containing protein
MNDQLEGAAELFWSLVENAPEAVVLLDADGTVRYANPAVRHLLGVDQMHLVGEPLAALVHPEDVPRLNVLLEAGAGSDGLDEFEIRGRHVDGTWRIFEAKGLCSSGAAESSPSRVLCLSDVTDRAAAHHDIRHQLRQAQKMEAVGRLAGGVAHDFNNLLQAMQGLVELLQRPHVDDTTARLRELEGHIQRASQLTRQLVLFSRPESSKVELLDLNRAVRETVLLLVRLLRENVDLIFEPVDESLALEADRGQIEQIVMNLAVNAADAMPDGGQLTIRTGRGEQDTVWLEVEDTGHGIPEEIREHLFEPFFTTRERSRGTGLGLSVVHGIVTLHGGQIEVDSEPAAGSRFRISLPAADASQLPDTGGEAELVTFVGSGERVLIVEDDPAVRESLKEILTGLGYRTAAVGTATEAVQVPDEPPFDLLLSDFGLPSSNGTEVAATLQRRWPELAVIIMSGYAEDDVISRHMMNGDLHFLQKPFTVQTLGKAVRNVLSQGR